MKRQALSTLTAWLHKNGRKPLILRGARQVGKSTLVRMAAESNGTVLWEVNLERHLELKSLFATRDPRRILRELPLVIDLPSGGETPGLLFLDEIQAIPEALVCLRYFHEELPQLPVVAAGSLLEFTLADTDFSMPVGRVEYLWLGPLSFTEFLRGTGDAALADHLDTWTWSDPLDGPLHNKYLTRLREYFIVGGMPEAVQRFADSGQFTAARDVHEFLIQTWRDDFGKYARGAALEKLRRVFDILPLVVGEKTKYRAFHPDWKTTEIREALDLLRRAGLIYPVTHTDASGLPLGAAEDPTVQKLFFLDIGLVVSAWNTRGLDLEAFLSGRFLQEGKLAEQFAAQSLAIAGAGAVPPRLHYWLREGKSSNAEVDFISQGASGLFPLEIKAGSSGSLRSLHQFMAAKGCPLAFRADANPPTVQTVTTTIPGPQGSTDVRYELRSFPLYLLAAQGWAEVGGATPGATPVAPLL